MVYVYVLKSRKDSKLYIGCTEDLKKRIDQHNQGKTKSIKHRVPFDLVYYEAYRSKTDARKREIELKKNSYQKERLLKQIGYSLEMS